MMDTIAHINTMTEAENITEVSLPLHSLLMSIFIRSVP